MKLWRRHGKAALPSSPVEDHDLGPTEGELARIRAERALREEMERTSVVQEQSREYVTLGERITAIYKMNHIRADVVEAMKTKP